MEAALYLFNCMAATASSLSLNWRCIRGMGDGLGMKSAPYLFNRMAAAASSVSSNWCSVGHRTGRDIFRFWWKVECAAGVLGVFFFMVIIAVIIGIF